VCVSGCCLHVFAHANAAVAVVNLLVPSSACGVPITKAIRAQLKKLIRRNKTRADFAAKFENENGSVLDIGIFLPDYRKKAKG
jgi:hypothetical protein